MRVPAVVLLSIGLMACGSSGKPPSSEGPPPNRPQESPAPLVSRSVGSSPETSPPALERVVSKCPLQREVVAGGDDSPEGVVFDAYRLALGEDTPTTQEAFFRLFSDGTPRAHVLENIWPRVREHVRKYVRDPGNVSYVLCRREDQTADRVKIFVKSFDDRKSDPPSVLVREEGRWRLDVMTP